MAKRNVTLTFPSEVIQEPLVYTLGWQYRVVTNIRRANVADDRGWVVLELEGEDKDIDEGLAWLTSRGVKVDPVVGDLEV